jgi:hypothetical protein
VLPSSHASLVCVHTTTSCRGLDSLGHVVFYHVPLFKVQRLLAAPLPRLRGQHLMTPTQVLRLAVLAQHGHKRESTAKALKVGRQRGGKGAGAGAGGAALMREAEALASAIVTQPFQAAASAPLGRGAAASGPAAAAGGGGSASALVPTAPWAAGGVTGTALQPPPSNALPPAQALLLHSFALGVRHLMDCHLLSRGGSALGLAGLATHLFWTEPANFVMVRYLLH